MRTPPPTALIALAVVLGGCGGGPDVPPAEALDDAPSYVLSIDSVTMSYDTPGVEPDPHGTDYRVGEEIRVDFEIDGDEIVAWVNRQWGRVHEYRGVAAGAPVVLEPVEGSRGVDLNGPATGSTRGTLWLQRLVVDAWIEDGRVAFGGVASFEGSALFSADDLLWSFAAEGDLTGRVDDVPPRARFDRHAPLGAVLPWEPFLLQLSEPVHRNQLLGRVHALGETVRIEADGDLERVTSARVYPSGWWSADARLEAWIEEGFTDPVGNVGDAARQDFPRMADVVPRASFDFEDPAASAVASWGDDAFDPPEWIECADASSGCLLLRRSEGGDAGVYARLVSTSPFTRIRARVRVLGEEPDWGFEPGAPVVLTVAAAAESLTDETRAVERLLPEVDEMLTAPYVSDTGFVTVELELGAPTTTAGAVLHFTDPYGYGQDTSGGAVIEGAGSPIPPAAAHVIVVDDLEVL